MPVFLFWAGLVLISLAGVAQMAQADPVPVEVVGSESGYQLLRGGEPYSVRGAGMVDDDLERFVARGGNSIRTWTTRSEDTDMPALLDRADELGVTVALTLPMQPERYGFDYDDEAAVAAQLEMLRNEVLRYRDHPAVLMWIIGNELNHSYTNPRVWDAVNDVARMIKELDPHHPATTAIAGIRDEDILEILVRAPALDFISFQAYGRIFELRETLARLEFEQPFMITEWGTIGWWEMEKTSWGAPVELNSSEKADVFLRAYQDIMLPLADQLLGTYAFFWGQKQERTPTWFGVLTMDGAQTEAADVLEYIWTGQWPAHRVARVEQLRLDGKSARDNVIVQAGRDYPVHFEVSGADERALTYRWEIKPESDATQVGGDYEAYIPSLDRAQVSGNLASGQLLVAEPGAYRLFAYAEDDHGRVAHANIPLLVEDDLDQ
ncbi:MAG: glycoside hydrolase family 2 TIM barrel-domain containing protein [Wenzhouxiangella sp.]